LKFTRAALALTLAAGIVGGSLAPAVSAPIQTPAAVHAITAKTAKAAKTKIVTQPKSVTVKPGQSTKFTVKATGAKLKYQWEMKPAGAKKWARATNGTKADLTVPKVATKLNKAQVRVTVSGANGKVTSNSAKLNVITIGAPVITSVENPIMSSSWSAKPHVYILKGKNLKYFTKITAETRIGNSFRFNAKMVGDDLHMTVTYHAAGEDEDFALKVYTPAGVATAKIYNRVPLTAKKLRGFKSDIESSAKECKVLPAPLQKYIKPHLDALNSPELKWEREAEDHMWEVVGAYYYCADAETIAQLRLEIPQLERELVASGGKDYAPHLPGKIADRKAQLTKLTKRQEEQKASYLKLGAKL
jgi:hypothetical protein